MSINRDINDYLYGKCHLYALVCSKMTGFKIEMLWDDDYWHEKAESPSTVLVHAYVVAEDGRRFDAEGLLTDERINEEYEWNHLLIQRHSVDEVENMIASNLLEDFEAGEETWLENSIRQQGLLLLLR